jgi:DNA-binding LytR/AlgR family response regulator
MKPSNNRRCSCIIIEDQLPAQRILQRYIGDIGDLELLGSFTDPLAALEFLRDQAVELIFLDIHLPKISGMDFLKILPYKPKVILTTAFSEYALEGYEYDITDYLLKPISFERFVKAVSKVIYHPDPVVADPPAAEKPAASPGYAFVKSDHVIIKIEFDSIRYIRSEDDFTRIFTTGKNHFLSYTLRFWLDLLPSGDFCRIHKSYIINLRSIEKIAGNEVYIGGERLPIGRGFREEFMAKLDLS